MAFSVLIKQAQMLRSVSGQTEDTRISFQLCPFRTMESTLSARVTWC